jgi:DNA-binding SARP family transcriptional activator
LDILTNDARKVLEDEAHRRPGRWSSALRELVANDPPIANSAAELLSRIGRRDDAAFLRVAGATRKPLRPMALAITRRLAVPVYLRDLGPVGVDIGGVPIARVLRRKVLGLLCFLASRPGQAASRDEAIEALWPDLGADTASNSLHQTIYFTRRIFEPDYREGMSAGYVGFDGDVLSLHMELVGSASRDAWTLISGFRSGDDTAIDRLLDKYQAKYALDFAYEEWASSYRDNLHAAVLDISEGAIATAIDRREFDRAIGLSRAVLAVDSSADSIELLLIRAYKGASRMSAAAEQYAHYASALREELGVEPPPIDAV